MTVKVSRHNFLIKLDPNNDCIACGNLKGGGAGGYGPPPPFESSFLSLHIEITKHIPRGHFL